MIDPDGEGGQKPFKVWCDMDSDQSTGITVVEHQYEVGLMVFVTSHKFENGVYGYCIKHI